MDQTPLSRLPQQIQGSVIKPSDSKYDDHRKGWNGYFDKKPLAIVNCKNSNDVVHTIRFVKKESIPFSVKSGGHDYAGHSIIDDGIVIDLSGMKAIEVDPVKKTVRAEPGNRWADVDKATTKHGLATTGATVSTVGIAGFTLGGGSGYIARKAGLSVDNLITADVVLASGEKVRASEQQNRDLFWALRGGSGNFGIVTSFTYRLHEFPDEIMAGQIAFPFDQAHDVLQFYREFMDSASDNLTCYAFFLNVPPVYPFPENQHGKSALFLVLAHLGSHAEAEKELKPLMNLGNPMFTAVQSMPYSSAQTMFDAGMTKGNRWYSKAHYLDSLSDEAMKTVLKFTRSIPGAFSAVYLEPMGGMINRVDSSTTAFPHRNTAYGLHIFPGWADDSSDETAMKWAKDFFNEMKNHANGGVYVNLLGQDEEDRTPEAYGENYKRLVKLKKKWDPENLFRNNHNIVPGS